MANLEESGLRTLDAWPADISKIKEVLMLKGIFSEIKYVCVLSYQISSFKKHCLKTHRKNRVKQFQLNDLLSQLTKLANIFDKLPALSEFFSFLRACLL